MVSTKILLLDVQRRIVVVLRPMNLSERSVGVVRLMAILEHANFSAIEG
jgi:hypothetical protein